MPDMPERDEIEFGDDFIGVCLEIIVFLIVLAIDIVIIVITAAIGIAVIFFEIGLAILFGGDDKK